MAEASIDGMAFFDGASTGAAFRLSEAAAEDSTETIGDWTIEVRAGSEIVVTRGDGGATYEEARDHALAVANKSLHFLCLRGATPMAIRHPGTEHQLGLMARAAVVSGASSRSSAKECTDCRTPKSAASSRPRAETVAGC